MAKIVYLPGQHLYLSQAVLALGDNSKNRATFYIPLNKSMALINKLHFIPEEFGIQVDNLMTQTHLSSSQPIDSKDILIGGAGITMTATFTQPFSDGTNYARLFGVVSGTLYFE